MKYRFAAAALRLIAFACLLNVVSPQAVNVTSTWISGTSTANSVSVLGTTGVPSTTIYPGARVMPCIAMTNQDSNYKLYMYGGQGYATATLNYLRDFWVLNVATMEWTMLTQNSVNTASLGTRGFESATSFPGTLGRMACLINPRDNYLYMFGGVTGSRFNDMWRYNPTSGYWAWLGGGTSATPSINTESGTIFPSARRNTAMVAHPTLNILIIMGGSGSDLNGNAGDMNDMWRFNLDTNSWTWFAGSVSALSVPTVFDTKGAATASNFPGGRNMHSTWMNPTTVVMYLFGGLGGTGPPYYNDMWSYDYAAGLWTWISGGTANNQPPVYGSSGVFDVTYTPGARASAIFSKVYGTTYISLYGGRGYGINSAAYNPYLNEMWFFDYSINQWAWIVGSNEANTYGTKGVTSVGPYPQGRNLYASSSMAFNQSLVIFGGFAGSTTNYMGDMWKVDFSVAPPVSTSSSSSSLVSSIATATSIASTPVTSSVASTSADSSTVTSETTSAATAVTGMVTSSLSSIGSMLSTASSSSDLSSLTISISSQTVLSSDSVVVSFISSSTVSQVQVSSSTLTSTSSLAVSSSSSSTSRSASVTATPSSSLQLLGSSTRISSSSSINAATATPPTTSSIGPKTTSTKLTVTAAGSSSTVQASTTLAVPGDTAALSDNQSGVADIFAQPAVIAALVAVVILTGILLIKLQQRRARLNNMVSRGRNDGGKPGRDMDHALTSIHQVAMPDGSYGEHAMANNNASHNSEYAQMPTQTSVAQSELSQQQRPPPPPPETLMISGNETTQSSASQPAPATEEYGEPGAFPQQSHDYYGDDRV